MWSVLYRSVHSSALPGMENGKPAGVRCLHLTKDNRCKLFGKLERPEVCNRLQPSEEMCGCSAQEALIRLASLERATAPPMLVNFKHMETIRGDVS